MGFFQTIVSAMHRHSIDKHAAADCRISSYLESMDHKCCNAIATMQIALIGKAAEMA